MDDWWKMGSRKAIWKGRTQEGNRELVGEWGYEDAGIVHTWVVGGRWAAGKQFGRDGSERGIEQE